MPHRLRPKIHTEPVNIVKERPGKHFSVMTQTLLTVKVKRVLGMLLIFVTYLLVLTVLLVAMIRNRLVKTEANHFLKSGSFWEAYIIGAGLTVLLFLIITSKELQLTDDMFLN